MKDILDAMMKRIVDVISDASSQEQLESISKKSKRIFSLWNKCLFKELNEKEIDELVLLDDWFSK